jgi:hypothetical protein
MTNTTLNLQDLEELEQVYKAKKLYRLQRYIQIRIKDYKNNSSKSIKKDLTN